MNDFTRPHPTRREMLAGAAAVIFAAPAQGRKGGGDQLGHGNFKNGTEQVSGRTGMHAFAFQTGDWIVRHRQLRQRLVGDDHWLEFKGTCRAWELLDGAGNVDDHWIGKPGGAYVAATVRRLEPDGSWSIWWIDSRLSGLDSPMRGTFENGIGTFFGKSDLDGKPIDVRFIWSRLTEKSPRWEQAFSIDGGKTWETNWIMDFDRAS